MNVDPVFFFIEWAICSAAVVVGQLMGRHFLAKLLTSDPCPRTGVCGPYEVDGRFYYLIPQAQWERLKERALGPLEYDT